MQNEIVTALWFASDFVLIPLPVKIQSWKKEGGSLSKWGLGLTNHKDEQY